MKALLFFLMSLISFQAKASFFIEPMVSYEMGSSNIDFTAAGTALKGFSTDKSTNSAINYGGRLGYITSSGFWLAGDYSAATSGKSKYDLHEDKFDRTAIGADIGMWSGRWNFWLGYNFTDKLEITQQGNTEKDKVSGTSMKVGIGYILLPHVIFNVEYAYRTYTKGDEASVDTTYANFDQYVSKYNMQSFSAGFSFPF